MIDLVSDSLQYKWLLHHICRLCIYIYNSCIVRQCVEVDSLYASVEYLRDTQLQGRRLESDISSYSAPRDPSYLSLQYLLSCVPRQADIISTLLDNPTSVCGKNVCYGGHSHRAQILLCNNVTNILHNMTHYYNWHCVEGMNLQRNLYKFMCMA